MQVEDDAGVGLRRPGEEALLVLLDQPHRAVDDLHLLAARIAGDLGHERRQRVALAENLGDPFGAAELRLQPLVEDAVVVLGIDAHLLLVGPVELPVGREVVAGVALEGGRLVLVREVEQLYPVALAELLLRRGHRRIVGHRPVAREHAAAQEIVRRKVVDRVLEVAVQEAVADALGKGAGNLVHRAQLGHPLQLAARDQAQRDGVDEAEQAVAADREAEQLGVLGAAAGTQLALRVDERERLDIGDEGRQRQPAAVDVRREAAAHRQPVGAGLLLVERPLLLAGEARRRQVLEQLRPLHAGFHLDQPALGVERQHLVHLADVEQHAVGGELLRAHGVAPAGDAQRALLGPRQLHRGAHGVDRLRLDDAVDPRRVELRVHVVDDDALGLRLGLGLGLFVLGPGGIRPGGGKAGEPEEFPAADHPSPLIAFRNL